MGLSSDYSDGTPRLSYRVSRGDGTVLADRRPEESFYAASTVKLAVLAAVARQLEAGTADLAERLVSRDTFSSQVPGAPDYRLTPDDVDHGMAPPGQTMPLAEVVERMVVVSSNEATNLLVERFGLGPVGEVLQDACATGVRMGRQFGDVAAARRDGVANVVTAGGLASLMSAVVTGRLCGPEWTRYMTQMLARQQYPNLAADLPEGVPWGSKSGSVQAIRHDVAWFGEPGPDCLVVAVCTRGMEHDQAGEAIEALGRLAHQLTTR
ncbi:serine hydrolase [Auraticoccus sp. F435]|uniref:Serine hydrolase n=1 Tax=Auraticoccus cholistanensis TaxID=2656650 RepID=A0A6A9UQE4_9ACTN|nr:serine hydrolase [Auraticoccus cholistanensis]MVA75116.1 serine hydrolase [Auraticoccus cholistanensis]